LKTPVCLFFYRRPDLTAKVFSAVAAAQPSKLLLIADGPASAQDAALCEETRRIVSQIDWECEVLRNYADTNLGVYKRWESGLAWVFEQCEEAIILEDDTVPSLSFFRFCEEMLDRYRDDSRVSAVNGFNCGYTSSREKGGWLFSHIFSAWGWATWRRAYAEVDFRMKYWPEFSKSRDFRNRLYRDELYVSQWRACLDSAFAKEFGPHDWKWTAWNLYTAKWVVIPKTNLIKNIGFRADGAHATDAPDPWPDMVAAEIQWPLPEATRLGSSRAYDANEMKRCFGIEPSHTRRIRKIRQLWRALLPFGGNR